MLEVISASVGTAIYGALRGYSHRMNEKPWKSIIAHSAVSIFCLYEIKRRASNQRPEIWDSVARTSKYCNDSIDTGSPKYLLENIPILIGASSGAFALVGSAVLISRRPKLMLTKWLERK